MTMTKLRSRQRTILARRPRHTAQTLPIILASLLTGVRFAEERIKLPYLAARLPRIHVDLLTVQHVSFSIGFANRWLMPVYYKEFKVNIRVALTERPGRKRLLTEVYIPGPFKCFSSQLFDSHPSPELFTVLIVSELKGLSAISPSSRSSLLPFFISAPSNLLTRPSDPLHQ